MGRRNAEEPGIGHNSMLPPKTAEIVRMPARVRLVCSQCGASAKGSCDCGVAYIPAGMRAAAAIEATPGKSDRLLAEEIGVDRETVGRARKKATGGMPPVERRTGRDGKQRKANKKKLQTAQQQVQGFLKKLSAFMDDFCLSLTQWHDENPAIDGEGKDALVHSLSTYSMQLQILAQKIDDREN